MTRIALILIVGVAIGIGGLALGNMTRIRKRTVKR